MSDKLKKAGSNFKKGFFQGIGWSFGVTIGFALVSALLVMIIRSLGGIPAIGGFFASIVESTQEQLLIRSPFLTK